MRSAHQLGRHSSREGDLRVSEFRRGGGTDRGEVAKITGSEGARSLHSIAKEPPPRLSVAPMLDLQQWVLDRQLP